MRLFVGNPAGVPIGPYYYAVNYQPEVPTWTGFWRSGVSESSLLSDLALAQANDSKTLIAMAGGSATFKNPDSTFNLTLWKSRTDRFASTDLSAYLADRTLMGNMIVDEPKARNTWGGVVIQNDVLDEMAAYSKTIWPDLPTVVRETGTGLIDHAAGWNIPWPGGDYQWTALDTVINQYRANLGAINSWCNTQRVVAEDQNLSTIYALQAITGGDGSSGVHVQGRPQFVMSPTEIETYGTRMFAEDSLAMLLIWRYYTASGADSCSACHDYWTTPEMQAAHAVLRALAAEHPERFLLRRLSVESYENVFADVY